MMFWSQQHSISLKQMHDLQQTRSRFHPNVYCHGSIPCIGRPECAPPYNQVGQAKCLSNMWVSLCRTSLPGDIAVRGNVRFTYFESFNLQDYTLDIPRPFISTTWPVKLFYRNLPKHLLEKASAETRFNCNRVDSETAVAVLLLCECCQNCAQLS